MEGEILTIMLKAPRLGRVKTRLAQSIGDEEACAAYRSLVETLLNSLEPLSNVDLCFAPDDAENEIADWKREEWTVTPQGEGDLGDRLTNTFARKFAEGVQRVVVIGSDCPDVKVSDIREAWSALSSNDVVLGPAKDGGYWLIGLKAPQPNLFQEIHWSSETVLQETLAQAKKNSLSVHLLRELTDVDTECEWNEFKNRK